jgi:hypothetical protein
MDFFKFLIDFFSLENKSSKHLIYKIFNLLTSLMITNIVWKLLFKGTVVLPSIPINYLKEIWDFVIEGQIIIPIVLVGFVIILKQFF